MKTSDWEVTMELEQGIIHFGYKVKLKKQKGRKKDSYHIKTISNRHKTVGLYSLDERYNWAKWMALHIASQKSKGEELLFGGMGVDTAPGRASRALTEIVRMTIEGTSLQNVSGHSTRRSAATAAMAAGAPKHKVASLGTWSQEGSVDSYLGHAVAATGATRHWFAHLRENF